MAQNLRRQQAQVQSKSTSPIGQRKMKGRQQITNKNNAAVDRLTQSEMSQSHSNRKNRSQDLLKENKAPITMIQEHSNNSSMVGNSNNNAISQKHDSFQQPIKPTKNIYNFESINNFQKVEKQQMIAQNIDIIQMQKNQKKKQNLKNPVPQVPGLSDDIQILQHQNQMPSNKNSNIKSKDKFQDKQKESSQGAPEILENYNAPQNEIVDKYNKKRSNRPTYLIVQTGENEANNNQKQPLNKLKSFPLQDKKNNRKGQAQMNKQSNKLTKNVTDSNGPSNLLPQKLLIDETSDDNSQVNIIEQVPNIENPIGQKKRVNYIQNRHHSNKVMQQHHQVASVRKSNQKVKQNSEFMEGNPQSSSLLFEKISLKDPNNKTPGSLTLGDETHLIVESSELVNKQQVQVDEEQVQEVIETINVKPPKGTTVIDCSDESFDDTKFYMKFKESLLYDHDSNQHKPLAQYIQDKSQQQQEIMEYGPLGDQLQYNENNQRYGMIHQQDQGCLVSIAGRQVTSQQRLAGNAYNPYSQSQVQQYNHGDQKPLNQHYTQHNGNHRLTGGSLHHQQTQQQMNLQFQNNRNQQQLLNQSNNQFTLPHKSSRNQPQSGKNQKNGINDEHYGQGNEQQLHFKKSSKSIVPKITIDCDQESRQNDLSQSIQENTFDFLGSYASDLDEDYSEKEDLIQNRKYYAKDLFQPFEKTIPKIEVKCLLKDQEPIDYLLGQPYQQHYMGVQNLDSPIGEKGFKLNENDGSFINRPYGIQNNDQSICSLMGIPRSMRNNSKRSPQKPQYLNGHQNNALMYDFENSVEPIGIGHCNIQNNPASGLSLNAFGESLSQNYHNESMVRGLNKPTRFTRSRKMEYEQKMSQMMQINQSSQQNQYVNQYQQRAHESQHNNIDKQNGQQNVEKSIMVEVTDKTFSFKDSLRESTKNMNNDTHASMKAKTDKHIGGANYQQQERVDQVKEPRTRCYQNNYYYNFNNNYGGPAATYQNRAGLEQMINGPDNENMIPVGNVRKGQQNGKKRKNHRQVTFEQNSLDNDEESFGSKSSQNEYYDEQPAAQNNRNMAGQKRRLDQLQAVDEMEVKVSEEDEENQTFQNEIEQYLSQQIQRTLNKEQQKRKTKHCKKQNQLQNSKFEQNQQFEPQLNRKQQKVLHQHDPNLGASLASEGGLKSGTSESSPLSTLPPASQKILQELTQLISKHMSKQQNKKENVEVQKNNLKKQKKPKLSKNQLAKIGQYQVMLMEQIQSISQEVVGEKQNEETEIDENCPNMAIYQEQDNYYDEIIQEQQFSDNMQHNMQQQQVIQGANQARQPDNYYISGDIPLQQQNNQEKRGNKRKKREIEDYLDDQGASHAMQQQTQFNQFYQHYFQEQDQYQVVHKQFNNEQLKELIEQMNVYIQLLYQILMISDSDTRKAVQQCDSCLNEQQFDNQSRENSQQLILNKQKVCNHYKQEVRSPFANPEKYRAYNLLYSVMSNRDSAIQRFKYIHEISPNQSFPKYSVPWVSKWMQIAQQKYGSFKNDIYSEESFTIHPQVSYFQAPLLEYAPKVIEAFMNPKLQSPQNLSQGICSQVINRGVKQDGNDNLEKHSSFDRLFTSMRPFLNLHFLPIDAGGPLNSGTSEIMSLSTPENAVVRKSQHLIANNGNQKVYHSYQELEVIDPFDIFLDKVNIENSIDYLPQMTSSTKQPLVFPYFGNNRRKFTYTDDTFLFLAMRAQGGIKYLDSIRDNWLPKKSTNEIKHRIKNLTCMRAPDNAIRRWKTVHNSPLRQGWVYSAKLEEQDGKSVADVSELGLNNEKDMNRYYNEMYKLGQGVLWFGVDHNSTNGQCDSNTLGNEMQTAIIEKLQSSAGKPNLKLLRIIKSPVLQEKLLLMSEFSRWNQISKFFLPSRTGEFLRLEYINIISNKEKSKKFSEVLLNINKEMTSRQNQKSLVPRNYKIKMSELIIQRHQQLEIEEQNNLSIDNLIKWEEMNSIIEGIHQLNQYQSGKLNIDQNSINNTSQGQEIQIEIVDQIERNQSVGDDDLSIYSDDHSNLSSFDKVNFD